MFGHCVTTAPPASGPVFGEIAPSLMTLSANAEPAEKIIAVASAKTYLLIMITSLNFINLTDKFVWANRILQRNCASIIPEAPEKFHTLEFELSIFTNQATTR